MHHLHLPFSAITGRGVKEEVTLATFRFDLYPLDSHICKFRVGSTNLNMDYMLFAPTEITYDKDARNTILDYSVNLGNIQEKDTYVTSSVTTKIERGKFSSFSTRLKWPIPNFLMLCPRSASSPTATWGTSPSRAWRSASSGTT